MGNILHKVGTGEFKPPESFCHSNYRYLHQRLSSKVSWFSESGHLLLVRPKISHILGGLDAPGSEASVKAEPRIHPGTLPFEPWRSLNQVNSCGKVEEAGDRDSVAIISSLEPSKYWKVNSYTPLPEIDPGSPHLNSDPLIIRPMHMQTV